MDDNFFRVSSRELFYSAMLLGVDRLVNVEYDFPTDDEHLAAELDETKRSLNRRKLLRENSKGEIAIDAALSACVAFCAKPEECSVIDDEGALGTIYCAEGSYMFLEPDGEGEYMARWFQNADSVDEYITLKLEETQKEGILDGGA